MPSKKPFVGAIMVILIPCLILIVALNLTRLIHGSYTWPYTKTCLALEFSR